MSGDYGSNPDLQKNFCLRMLILIPMIPQVNAPPYPVRVSRCASPSSGKEQHLYLPLRLFPAIAVPLPRTEQHLWAWEGGGRTKVGKLHRTTSDVGDQSQQVPCNSKWKPKAKEGSKVKANTKGFVSFGAWG